MADPVEDDNDEPDEDKKPGEKFSQEDLRRIAAREKREGKTAGRKELLKDLGLESEDDLKALLQNHREQEDAKKSETEKAKQAADKEKEASRQERAAARQERFDTRCERALLAAGVDSEKLSKISRLVDMEWDPSQEVPDLEVFKDAVSALKEDMPALFTSEGDSQQDGKNPDSNPRGTPPRPKPKGGEGMGTGRDMLASRHPAKK